jgi:glycosyltransferase involved in cell wall biosynthesis
MGKSMISICMPTYNGERFITEAFASINAQDYRNFEVIISDDASKDNTKHFNLKQIIPYIFIVIHPMVLALIGTTVLCKPKEII